MATAAAAFISTKNWLSGSADLKTPGCFGEHGMPKASQWPGEPEEILAKEVAEISLDMERAARAEWLECLKASVEADGGHFE